MSNYTIHADEAFLDALSASWIISLFSPKPAGVSSAKSGPGMTETQN